MTREALPNRRRIEHFDLVCNGILYTVGVGLYPDGRVGEIFLDSGKAGTDLRRNTHDMAAAVSIALQHGATVEEMSHTFSQANENDLEPGGILGAVLNRLMADEQQLKQQQLQAAE